VSEQASVGQSQAKIEKAYLSILEPSATGGSETGRSITLQFNPTDLAVSKAASWGRIPQTYARQANVPEFLGTQPRTLSLHAYLDRSDDPSGDVSADVEELLGCLNPTPQSIAAGRPSPPFVVFGWGSAVYFHAVLLQVDALYTLFRGDGTPIRAECSLVMEEIPVPERRQNPTSGALAARRTHVLTEGETLPLVAFRELGDSNLWRALAEVNGIDDPLRLRPGASLLVPSLEEATALLAGASDGEAEPASGGTRSLEGGPAGLGAPVAGTGSGR
jgi:nucleoid-associated protein YgaU